MLVLQTSYCVFNRILTSIQAPGAFCVFLTISIKQNGVGNLVQFILVAQPLVECR